MRQQNFNWAVVYRLPGKIIVLKGMDLKRQFFYVKLNVQAMEYYL